jgi:tetratricopeptide (TPR) repeat protein
MMCERTTLPVFFLCLAVAAGNPASAQEGKAPADPAAQEAAPEPSASDPADALVRALALYEGGTIDDFYFAVIELFKVVEAPDADEASRMKAEFFMGKALYKLRFYSSSMTYFDKVVQKGGAHPHFNETLKWLAALSHELPESAGVLDKIGKYNRAEIDTPGLTTIRDELYFLLGKFHYTQGKFKEAIDLFEEVSPKSDFYVQAKLFQGATHVREYQARPAVDAFKEVLRVAAASRDPKIKPFEDLANLSLARTFYSTGQYDLAVKYFDRVSIASYDWPNSLFESSWANFNLEHAGYAKALGGIHSIQAPYFEHFIKPESLAEALTVKATIYYYNCLYASASEAIAEFNNSVPALVQELKQAAEKYTDNDAFFDFAIKVRAADSALPAPVEHAVRAVLSDRSLARRFNYILQLDKELRQYENADPAWKSTAVANAVLTDITLQRSLMVNETGELARKRVERLVGELSSLLKRVIKIEYEILQGEKGQIEQEIVKEEQNIGPEGPSKIGAVAVDDEHQYWPFTGEYWRDELGYYRFRIPNKCEKRGPEGAPAVSAGP